MFSFFKRKKKNKKELQEQQTPVDNEALKKEQTTPDEEQQAEPPVSVKEEQTVSVSATQQSSLAPQSDDQAQPQPQPQIQQPKTQPQDQVQAQVAPQEDTSVSVKGTQEAHVENIDAVHEFKDQAVVGAEPTTPEPVKKGWMSRLRQGLSRTGSNLSSLFVGVKVDENLFEELETALLMADAGVEATEKLLNQLRQQVKKERLEDAIEVKEALKTILSEHLKPLEKTFMLPEDDTSIVMIAGVNGAGKTTSIGKLANHFQASGASVLLAAGDTFRAAAREQLIEWGHRNNVTVIAQDGGDPAAVAFDAVNAGKARQANVVMVDTAGRLPTQLHLMEELKKIKRVIAKADAEAPHEILLVVDGNTGQNAIAQIKAFDAALNLTGLVVTKLDGTAKGGTLAAVAAGAQGVRPIPVYWIGVGESLHDLQPFDAAEFASALLD